MNSLNSKIIATVALLSANITAWSNPPGTEPERAIQLEVEVSASPADVWKVLTTTEGVTSFFAKNAHVELTFGGPYEVYFAPQAEHGSRGGEGCKVLGYVVNELLMVSWNAPPTLPDVRGQRTFVVFKLENSGDGETRVHLTNGGYKHGGEWDKSFEYFSQAWPHVLTNLKNRFDRGPLWPRDECMKITPPAMQQFACFLTPVSEDTLSNLTPEQETIVQKHLAYMKHLLASNQLVVAGRCGVGFTYPTGRANAMQPPSDVLGVFVFEAESKEKATSWIADDPAVKAGLLRPSLSPIRIVHTRP